VALNTGHHVNHDATAFCTAAAIPAGRILARRPLFRTSDIDAELDPLGDAEEADLHALAAVPGAVIENARVLAAIGSIATGLSPSANGPS